MGLIGNGIYYSPRLGLCPGGVSAVGSCPTTRPIWNAICHRQIFDKDYLSLPSGAFNEATVMPIKYGGISMRDKSAASVSGSLVGMINGACSINGAATIVAALTGLKNSPCTMHGSGSFTASAKGNGSIKMTVSIGAQPSAFDIAQAVWGMDNGIETGWTPRQVMRIVAAVMAGKVSGAGANAPVFRSIGDTKPRVTAVTDASGDRTSITLDAD